MKITTLINSFKQPEERFSFFIVLVLFTLPFGWQNLSNFCFLALILNSLFSLKLADWKSAIKSPLFYLSAGFFVYSALSLLWSSQIQQGLTQLETKSSFLMAPLVLVAGQRFYNAHLKEKVLKAFLYGNLAVCVLALFYAGYQVFSHKSWYFLAPDGSHNIYYFTYETLSKPFMHPGYLSTYLGFAIFIALYFLIQTNAKTKLFYAAILGFFFVMMVLLQGRINVLAMLAVLAAGSLIVAIKKKAYKWLAVPMVPVLLLGVFVLLGSESLKERYLQIPDFSYDISGNKFNSATYRLAEWSCALDAIEKNWLLGSGLGDNRIALFTEYENRKFWEGLSAKYNAHNQFLETAIATGLIGVAMLLLLLFGYAKIAFVNKDFLSLACLAFFVISMLTESMLERAWAVVLFTSYFPLMLLLATKSKE